MVWATVSSSLTTGQERSSSKRKEMWRTIQVKANDTPSLQLILDMKVRWSSTFLMLDRAERKKKVCSDLKLLTCAYYLISIVR